MRQPAQLNTFRGTMWLILTAVCFVGMSHPKIIEPSMVAAFYRLSWAAVVVMLIDFRAVRFPRVPNLVLAFLGFCLLSMLWSTDPLATGRATAYYAGMGFLAVLLVANQSTRLLFRGLAIGGLLVVVLSLGAVWVGHPQAEGIAPGGSGIVLQGLYGNRNILSYVLLFGLCCLLVDRVHTWYGFAVKVACIGVYFWLFLRTHSATGLLGAVLVTSVAVMFALARWLPDRFRRLARRLTLGIGAATVVGLLLNAQRLLDHLGRDSTLSGRLPLWEAVVQEWLAVPLQGYGWGAVWAYAWFEIDPSEVRGRISEQIGTFLNHGHNAVLDILIQVGVVGTAIYLAVLVQAFVRAVKISRRGRSEAGTAIFLLVSLFVTAGITEPLFTVPLGWFLVVVVATLAARESADLSSAGHIPVDGQAVEE